MGQARRPTLLLLLLVIPLALVACGGDDDASEGAQSDQPAASSTPVQESTEPGLSEAEASELAKSMLLRLSDFPTGWRAEAAAEEGCRAVDEVSDRFDLVARELSDGFFQGEVTGVQSGAAILADEQTAREALDFLEGRLQSDEFLECIADVAREDGAEVGEVTSGQVSFPAMGERSSAWEVVIPFTSDGVSITGYADAIYILRDNAIAFLSFTDAFTPFDPAERERLAGLVADRMEEALGQMSG